MSVRRSRLVVAMVAVAVTLTGVGASPSVGRVSAGPAVAAPLGWEPTAAETARARSLVGRMTLPQRAGQVLVASYQGTRAPVALVRELHLGGVVAFASNLTTPGRVRANNRTLQRAVASRGYPLMIAVDQEGGRVARLTTGATRFPGLMTAGAAGDPALTLRAYRAAGGEVADVGFTVDFAPDADVTTGPADPAIGSRSAGSSPSRVADQVVAATRGLSASGMVPVLKHFPGHGSVTTDSHLGLPVQRRSLATLRARDLVPFRAGVRAGAPMVMVGHLDVRAVDAGRPSSLSRKVVTGLLRSELGFRGVVVTDSLQMHAIVDRYGVAGAAVRALNAGVDVLLMPGSPRVARAGIVAAVRAGRVDPARLREAATRMVALQLHQRTRGYHRRVPGSSTAVARRLSAAGVTSVAGPCSGRLVGASVHVTGPSAVVERFESAVRAAGLAVSGTGTTVRLAGLGAPAQRGAVVIALDTPYLLGTSRARVKLATYGDSPGDLRAAARVLAGLATAPGRLPVTVDGVARRGC